MSRLPNLSPGMRAIELRANRHLGVTFLEDPVCFQATATKLVFPLSLFEGLFLACCYATGLNWKPSGTKPMFA